MVQGAAREGARGGRRARLSIPDVYSEQHVLPEGMADFVSYVHPCTAASRVIKTYVTQTTLNGPFTELCRPPAVKPGEGTGVTDPTARTLRGGETLLVFEIYDACFFLAYPPPHRG